MGFKPLACGFHSHTDISLDGGSTVEGKIKRAAQLGRIADCVTDHGLMSNLVPHWTAAQKLLKDKKISIPIKSIHGIEAYIIDPLRQPKVFKNGKIEPRYMHITIHFKDVEAYRYFCQLTPKMEARAVMRYGERKPLMTIEELEAISGHITLGSGCLGGLVQQNVLRGQFDWARQMYERIRHIAGPGNFFVEVFPHILDKEWHRPERDAAGTIIKPGEFVPITTVKMDEWMPEPEPCKGGIDIQKMPNQFVLDMAKRYGDPVIISLDDHYAAPEDKVVQEARIGNGQEGLKFYGTYASFTTEECAESFRRQLDVKDFDIEQWVDNSYRFVELFDKYKLESSKDRWLLPTTEMVYNVQGASSKVKLWELIKHHGRLPAATDERHKTYMDRLKYEVSVLADNGVADFLPYFFVLEDAAQYAKKNGIMWNTRGSAGGSLVLFLIGVSITDPIKYGLPFERFLTLGRIKSGSLPDIDTDWEDRDLILQYLRQKYGEQVALIATNLMLRLKSSILDVERSTKGMVSAETHIMCRAIKGAPQGVSDKDWLFGYKDKTTGAEVKGFWDESASAALRKYSTDNPEIWSTVLKCIGITKTRGIHAGGIVLTPGPVQNHMPLVLADEERGYATAYDMKSVEYVGGVKYDFLGVTTLKALGISMRSIRDTIGIDMEWGEFPHDPAVYSEIMAKDLMEAIFQLNTNIARPYVARIKPKRVLDAALITSMCRPGTLDAPSPDPSDGVEKTAATYFVDCAQGKRKAYYIHADLEALECMRETYGILIYQEQTLELFRELAGYSYEQAEEVRRGIGKKDKDLLNKHSAVLKQKCIERGWTEKQASRLFDSIEASAKYSFNKSHATSYAIVAYNGCYLKHHYPLHFWKGELTVHSDDHDKIREYLSECRKYVLPVDVVRSHPTDWIIEGEALRPPLCLIKGAGALGVSALKRFIETDIDKLEVGDAVE